jgi:hypothetical protein
MHAFGPVLYFRGVGEGGWRLRAVVGAPDLAAPPPLTVRGAEIPAAALAGGHGGRLWSYDFSLPLARGGSHASYRIGKRTWEVRVPAEGEALRVAFTACNGSEEGDAWGESKRRNERWLHLASRHAAEPFHLLLQGGDQLYADPIWSEVPELAAWRRMPARRRLACPFTPSMAAAVDRFYFDAYCRVWGQPELGPLLARIPSLMLWDDHDIIDGWGSYPAKWHDAPVLQGIWRHAREYFSLFQLGARPDELPDFFCDRRGGHFGWALRIGEVGIIAPDLRSERSRRNILGEAGWRDFTAALEGLAECRHVLLVFTVPLVNAQLPKMERLFNSIPGHQSWEDDLVDQWPSLAHREEWLRLLRLLTEFSARTGARLTALSGEVHLGALGEIEGAGARILQLTSSGIVHPPPNRLMTEMLEWASRGDMQAGPGLAVRALPMPGRRRRYLATRNWLELDVQRHGTFRATWHPETGEPVVLAIDGEATTGGG